MYSEWIEGWRTLARIAWLGNLSDGVKNRAFQIPFCRAVQEQMVQWHGWKREGE